MSFRIELKYRCTHCGRKNLYRTKHPDRSVRRCASCGRDFDVSPEVEVVPLAQPAMPTPDEPKAVRRVMRYVLAVVACGIELIAYATIGVLLGWKSGGGVIAMMVLCLVWVSTWTAITKHGEPSDDNDDDSEPPRKLSPSANETSASDNAQSLAPPPAHAEKRMSSPAPLERVALTLAITMALTLAVIVFYIAIIFFGSRNHSNQLATPMGQSDGATAAVPSTVDEKLKGFTDKLDGQQESNQADNIALDLLEFEIGGKSWTREEVEENLRQTTGEPARQQPAKATPSARTEQILQRAKSHVDAHEYDRAISDYTEAIRLNPKNAAMFAQRALVYAAKREYDQAIADCTEAIRLDSKNASTYFGRGLAFMSKDDCDNAIADFTEAIRLEPTDAYTYRFRGDAYRINDDYESAIADCTEAIRLDSKSAAAYGVRGWSYFLKDEYNSAIADFTEAIRLDSKNASAYDGRGTSYCFKYDYDSAITDLTQAIRLDTKNDAAYFFRGKSYYLKDDYDSAIADYTEAIRLDPKAGEAYFDRGLAYQAKGQRAAAERNFAQAKKLGYKQ